MAKRAVRSTTTRRSIDSIKVGATAQSDVTSPQNGHPTEDEVRVRAYHRYLERGGSDGNDIEDWVRAEQELRHERQS